MSSTRYGLSLATLAVAASCMPAGSPDSATEATTITVTSPAFANKGMLPVDFSCDGENMSPAFVISSPPERAQALVVVLEDSEPGRTGVFTHWIVYDVPATVRAFSPGVDASTVGGLVGKNDFGRNQYNGPCPPSGDVHTYVLRVFAVDKLLGLPPGADRAGVAAAMRGHTVGAGELRAVFGH